MVAYTIVTKWWWKKLREEIKWDREEIKWELMSVHPKIRDSRMELSALSCQRSA
jgi:hypothetical protein